ncbi:MAG: glycoside hydrolase family 38 C-terminal domain-containing protein, partial [Planctomycetota bacterium]
GAYSSRIELKQWTRSLETLLLTTEKLGVISGLLGRPRDMHPIWAAWEPVLFNQAHDLASGVMTDHVYDDTIQSYHFTKRLGDELVEARLRTLLANIDTRGEGVPLVVFNGLGSPRTDVAEVKLGFSQPGVLGLKLLDPDGSAVPAQLLDGERYGDGGLRVARILFLARDVPAMGYSVYRAVPVASAEQSSLGEGKAIEADAIENEWCRLTFDRATGAMTSLVVKPGDWELLSGPANVVTCQHDAGDLWELYKPLDGGSRIAMKDRQPVPQPGETKFSNLFTGEPGSLVTGPVFSQYEVTHPFGEKGEFATRVRLYAGLRRIDVHTEIVNHEKHVRYQALFPTTIEGGRSVHEIPFGASERPEGVEFPAQNWVDYGNDQRGLTLLNRGLPGNVVTDGTMMLSLARATRIVAYGFGGGYEPGMTSDTGYELGKRLMFDYALVPRSGPWREAGPWRQGLKLNHPLVVRKAASHEGALPSRWGLLETSHANVVLSALKPGHEGTAILRVYEAAGQPAPAVTIKFRAEIASASEANLMEDPGRKLEVTDNTLKFDLGPFEIKTFQLDLQPAL